MAYYDTDERSHKIDLDELYEKKQAHNLATLDTFNKVLARAHKRIRTISQQKINEPFCWYPVPEIILGTPKYNHSECIAYVMNNLTENGFNVKYFAPNILFISWDHWVPGYVRNEIKKKTGIVVDGYGNLQKTADELEEEAIQQYEEKMSDQKKEGGGGGRSFTSVKNYKPTGAFVYNEDMFARIGKKLG